MTFSPNSQSQDLQSDASVAFPPPIASLNEKGQISSDEVELARDFYGDVVQSGLMPRLIPDLVATIPQFDVDPEIQASASLKVRGIFSLLNAIDERLLATVCALILEMKLANDGQTINVEEVGRRIMGYDQPQANQAAGAALLRASLWIIRFGYQNPTIFRRLLEERAEVTSVSLPRQQN